MTVELIPPSVAAFLQGLNLVVAFWPGRQSGQHGSRGTRQQANKDAGVKSRFRVGAPTAQVILGEAQDCVLLLGTSNARTVDMDFEAFGEWLDNDNRRLIGLLFLNPHSPHAVGRQRENVKRSAAKVIQEKLRAARELDHDRLIVAVYEGPYRYSARAVDVGRRRAKSRPRIDVFTSSHNRGISGGFRIELEPTRISGPFEAYREELLDLWKTAHLNSDGHGVSIVSRWKMPVRKREQALLTRKLEEHCEVLIGRIAAKREHKLLLPHQLHLTISSLCRTQRNREAGPLVVNNEDGARNLEDGARYLPEHFPEFASYAMQLILTHVGRQDLTFTLDRLVLDSGGCITLQSSETQRSLSRDGLNAALGEITELREQYERAYPDEGWDEELPGEAGYRFGPKYDAIVPHVAIGRSFTRDTFLPLPLEGKQKSIAIRPPIEFVGDGVSLVHYAYRTLLRCIGEAHVPLRRVRTSRLDPVQVLRLLRI